MMKLKFSLVLIALYLLLLAIMAPATILTRYLPSNLGLKIGHVSGSIWNGKLSHVVYRKKSKLQQLTWQFDWLALLKLSLKVDVQVENTQTMLMGIGSVSYGFSGLMFSDINVEMKTSELTPYLTLPIPVTPLGKLTLVIESATQGAPYCTELDGLLVWHDAKVETSMANIDLALVSVDLSCVDGELVAVLAQDSDELTTNATVSLSAGEKYQLKGDIIAGEALDPTIFQALSWLGAPQKSGETLLNFKGQL